MAFCKWDIIFHPVPVPCMLFIQAMCGSFCKEMWLSFYSSSFPQPSLVVFFSPPLNLSIAITLSNLYEFCSPHPTPDRCVRVRAQ